MLLFSLGGTNRSQENPLLNKIGRVKSGYESDQKAKVGEYYHSQASQPASQPAISISLQDWNTDKIEKRTHVFSSLGISILMPLTNIWKTESFYKVRQGKKCP